MGTCPAEYKTLIQTTQIGPLAKASDLEPDHGRPPERATNTGGPSQGPETPERRHEGTPPPPKTDTGASPGQTQPHEGTAGQNLAQTEATTSSQEGMPRGEPHDTSGANTSAHPSPMTRPTTLSKATASRIPLGSKTSAHAEADPLAHSKPMAHPTTSPSIHNPNYVHATLHPEPNPQTLDSYQSKNLELLAAISLSMNQLITELCDNGQKTRVIRLNTQRDQYPSCITPLMIKMIRA